MVQEVINDMIQQEEIINNKSSNMSSSSSSSLSAPSQTEPDDLIMPSLGLSVTQPPQPQPPPPPPLPPPQSQQSQQQIVTTSPIKTQAPVVIGGSGGEEIKQPNCELSPIMSNEKKEATMVSNQNISITSTPKVAVMSKKNSLENLTSVANILLNPNLSADNEVYESNNNKKIGFLIVLTVKSNGNNTSLKKSK